MEPIFAQYMLFPTPIIQTRVCYVRRLVLPPSSYLSFWFLSVIYSNNVELQLQESWNVIEHIRKNNK